MFSRKNAPDSSTGVLFAMMICPMCVDAGERGERHVQLVPRALGQAREVVLERHRAIGDRARAMRSTVVTLADHHVTISSSGNVTADGLRSTTASVHLSSWATRCCG